MTRKERTSQWHWYCPNRETSRRFSCRSAVSWVQPHPLPPLLLAPSSRQHLHQHLRYLRPVTRHHWHRQNSSHYHSPRWTHCSSFHLLLRLFWRASFSIWFSSLFNHLLRGQSQRFLSRQTNEICRQRRRISFLLLQMRLIKILLLPGRPSFSSAMIFCWFSLWLFRRYLRYFRHPHWSHCHSIEMIHLYHPHHHQCSSFTRRACPSCQSSSHTYQLWRPHWIACLWTYPGTDCRFWPCSPS